MARFIFALVALVALASLGRFSPAAADFTVAAHTGAVRVADEDASKTDATAVPTKSAGTIDGVVTAIDYRTSTMSVSAVARKVDVTILPSTNITGANNSFRTIADIQKGSHVRVLLSQRAGTYTAQIITLR